MRIIAGEFRGRKLLSPEGDVTRPITDRVKQSLFDILAPRLEGAVVWDLFAGTGSLGLESLSRGARQAVFFETHRGAVARLRRNIAQLALPRDRAVVRPTDVFGWFRAEPPGKLDAGGRRIFPSPGTPGEGQGEGLCSTSEKPTPPRHENAQDEAAGTSPPKADIVFLDPPYRYLTDQPEDLRRLGRVLAQLHLRPQGIVVFRHDARDALELPDLSRYDERTYGAMMVEFLALARS
jgi:16S rRNA (guanine966-N2)-methyltransferase